MILINEDILIHMNLFQKLIWKIYWQRFFNYFLMPILYVLILFAILSVISLSRFKWNRKSDRRPNFACLVKFAEQQNEFVLGFYREIFQNNE